MKFYVQQKRTSDFLQYPPWHGVFRLALYAFITLFSPTKQFRYKLQLRRVRKLKKDFHVSHSKVALPSANSSVRNISSRLWL